METPNPKADSGTRGKTIKKLLGRRRASDISTKSKKAASQSNDVSDTVSKAKGFSQTPTTVAEAQIVGESARMNDDLIWALDGLESSSKENSLADLLDLLSSRRGKLVLQGEGCVEILVRKLSALDFMENPRIALATACILLVLTMRGKVSIFTKGETIELLKRIILCREAVPILGDSARLGKSVSYFLSDQHVSRLIPKEVSFSPMCICLALLIFCLRPREDYDATNIKLLMGKSGSLNLLVDVAIAESGALNDPRPTMKTVQGLWKLKSLLSILEHACFACPENVSCLSTLHVTAGCPPFLSEMVFTQWLGCQIKVFCSQKLLPEGLKKDCFQGVLAVIMNITEGNKEVARAISESDGLEQICYCLKYVTLHHNISTPSIATINPWIDEISALLGILINIVEADDNSISKIKSITLNKYHSGDSRDRVLDIIILLFVLSSDEKGETDCASRGGEVTLDSLREGEGKAMGSAVSVYSGILLGFMIAEDPLAYSQSLELLPFETLDPVITTITKCLAFYKGLGALTPRTEVTLKDLITKLESRF